MFDSMIYSLIFNTLFAIFSSAIAVEDIRKGEVPRLVFLIAFPFFITLKIFLPGLFSLWETIAGLVAGIFVFFIAFLFSGKKLGLADVWFSALIGLVMGPWWWYAAIGSACIAGIIYMVFFRLHRIPFIPFMALGIIIMSIIKIF